MLRVATFNLENLFTRPTAMNLANDADGRKAIEDHAIANQIIKKETYSDSDKNKLLELTHIYKWHQLNQPDPPPLVLLQKIRGQLFRNSQGNVTVAADKRSDWVGWFELLRDDVNWQATYNTGRVINETNPDILITVEVENRPTLERFNEQILGSKFNSAYPHCMVVDGNDMRGIDVGILSRFPITEIRSHVDDLLPNGNDKLFSRDCPEFDISLPNGQRLIVIPNHFKSKRNGNDETSKRKRRLQAEGAHAIAKAARIRSPFVLLGGDLNDTPDSETLASLFTNGFKDVSTHASYPSDRPGTYKTGTAANKIDYLIMSSQLRAKLRKTGIERRGTYHPNTWEPFDTVTNATENASDHHLVWADFNFGF